METELPVVAIDIVMIGAGRRGGRDVAGKVSIVNQSEQIIYSHIVKHKLKIKDYRTDVSGITERMYHDHGISYKKVKKDVADLIRGHILVGHELEQLKVLGLSHPDWNKRDSADYFETDEKQPTLRKVVAKYLGTIIQNGVHDTHRMALMVLRLYKNYKKGWDEWVEEQQADEEQSDEEQSDEEMSEEEQSDEEQSDEEQSDEEMSDEEQSDEEMSEEESEYDSEEEDSYD